jgi:hypothetical protein
MRVRKDGQPDGRSSPEANEARRQGLKARYAAAKADGTHVPGKKLPEAAVGPAARVEQIVKLMVAGQWVPGRSHEALVAEWKVSRGVVENAAAEAWRRIQWVNGGQRESLRERAIGHIEQAERTMEGMEDANEQFRARLALSKHIMQIVGSDQRDTLIERTTAPPVRTFSVLPAGPEVRPALEAAPEVVQVIQKPRGNDLSEEENARLVEALAKDAVAAGEELQKEIDPWNR